jgi:hypothetical protein
VAERAPTGQSACVASTEVTRIVVLGKGATGKSKFARDLAAATGIVEELREAASVERSLDGADVTGGTAPKRVREALALAKARLGESS